MIQMIVAHRRDIEMVSRLLRPAILQAEEQWVPVNAIAEALVEELQRLVLCLGEPAAAAAYLRALADEVEATGCPGNLSN